MGLLGVFVSHPSDGSMLGLKGKNLEEERAEGGEGGRCMLHPHSLICNPFFFPLRLLVWWEPAQG